MNRLMGALLVVQVPWSAVPTPLKIGAGVILVLALTVCAYGLRYLRQVQRDLERERNGADGL